MAHDESVIKSEINKYLQPSENSPFLTSKVKLDILLYLVNTNLSEEDGSGAKCDKLKNYLMEEKKYPVFDEKQSRAICYFLGSKKPPFIEGRHRKGYYFDSKKYSEVERKLIRQYLEQMRRDKLSADEDEADLGITMPDSHYRSAIKRLQQ